ncbi:MAG: DUF2225 domain-containing protein [Candidatus Zixiibacteriota bacterium]|nr:MAG: DUF2225 domain-containing protein [candidate division Zixibacteria bacterium]
MTTESPFFLTKVECPICKTINEFETIKVGAYTERDRDTDFCPTDRIWRNPRYQAHNPLLYFTATCANCFYTREFNNSLKEWKDDAYFKTYRLKVVKQKHLNMMAEADSIIRTIGEALNSNRTPGETAILKLLLAIIDESLNDRRNELDLGRFYLRIGWIFRDMSRGENPNEQMMRSHLSEIRERLETLRGSLESCGQQVRSVETTIASQLSDEKMSTEMRSLLLPIKDRYDGELAALQEILASFDGKLDLLEVIVQEHRQLSLGIADDTSEPGFGNCQSFHQFLSQLTGKWERIPLNEKDALTYAVEHYKNAFKDGKDISHGNQQIQASYLIAELSRRIGDFEQAKEYFNNTIRTGQEFIYQNRKDQSRTALARKILELAIEQGRTNMAEATAV